MGVHNLYMKKSAHHRSKQLLINPQPVYQEASRGADNNRSQKVIYSPVRHFQIHPFSQMKVDYGSRMYVPYQGIESAMELNSHKDRSQFYKRVQSPVAQEYVPMEHVITLQERLRNVHDHYKKLISDEKVRNTEKSEVIMGLLDEMQVTHNEKIEAMRKMIEQSEQQKREAGQVDGKMNEIKSNIDQLIEQSNVLKSKNRELQKKIGEKTKVIEEKESELQQLNQQLLQARTELQQFELANLRNNKVNRQIMQIFNSASTISSN